MNIDEGGQGLYQIMNSGKVYIINSINSRSTGVLNQNILIIIVKWILESPMRVVERKRRTLMNAPQ